MSIRKGQLLKRRSRAQRIRARLRGTAAKPRLTVFRSLRHLSVQLVDDVDGVTIASASDRELAAKKGALVKRLERAHMVGQALAKKALAKGVRAARFDRGPYRYHGLVRAVAEGAREGGLAV